MAQFPISTEDAEREIKNLIAEKSLDVITSKMIRKHLEAKFNCDFEECKANLDALIESCIYGMEETGDVKLNSRTKKADALMKKEPSDSPSDTDDEEEKLEVEPVSSKPSNSAKNAKTLKRKVAPPSLEAEPVVSEEEDMATSIKRRRSNPGAAKSKKREKRVKSDDKPNKGKRGTMFTKICALSPELSNLLGKRYLRRSDVVKEMWNYFRTNNLQDPKNKQFYYLDEPLKKLFGKKTKIKPFGMMATLKNHVKDIEFLDEATRQKAEVEIAEMLELENGENSNSASLLEESNSNEQQEEEAEEESTKQTEVGEDTFSTSESSKPSVVASAEEELDLRPSTSSKAYQPDDNGQKACSESSGSADSSAESSSSEESATNDY